MIAALLALLVVQDPPSRGIPQPPAPRPAWADSLTSALETAKEKDRCVLLYIIDPAAPEDPRELCQPEVTVASKTTWIFVKRPADDPELGEYNLKKGGVALGLDKYGNEFRRAETLTANEVKSILGGVPDLARKCAARVHSDFSLAEAAAPNDENRAARLYADVIRTGRKGYPEIGESLTRLAAISDRQFKAIELSSFGEEAQPYARLTALALVYKETPPGVEAETRIAEIEFARGTIPSALGRLKRLRRLQYRAFFAEAVARSQALYDKYVAEGLARVQIALQVAAAGERSRAVDALREVSRDFADTEAGEKAAQAIKTVNP